MTNVFEVVGEHREEPTRLLMRGDDGLYYAFAASDNHLTMVASSSSRSSSHSSDGSTIVRWLSEAAKA